MSLYYCSEGTQAKDTKFVYNDVKNITKESVELHNSYRSSSNRGINAGATIGYGHKLQTTGNGGSISVSKSNQNTVETIHANGNFRNVNEVHNNTGTMTLSGFNQEGGKVTGNIGKLVVESRQNTSTTTGSSSGIGIGISANGMPNSVNVNGSRTNGSRAFVDNQSSFIVGEGSNLHVGTVENTGAIIGKQSENSTTFKVDNYVGHDIQNYDTMTTTGISVGTSLGKSPRVTNIGFNQETGDKQGITRNTVVGNVEIGEASGSPINRDVTKANEVTKDEHHSTNVNVESQTIEYATNPTKFKEDLEVAILEGKATGETVLKTIENLVNGGKEDIGDPERRSLNEIKEAVIRVKTAPEMNLIATGDLNSQEVLDTLKINGIEKFNPDDPDLPENVRARLDELEKDGKSVKAFYNKTTNKIFVNENLTDDAEIRASVAREWKISEDLKDGKGKVNDEDQLKSTVAGELAYDDMMKRAREGKTGSISTSELDEAVMDINSEITADKWERTKFFFRTLGNLGAGATNMVVQGGKATGNTIIAGYHYATGNKKAGDARIKRAQNNVKNVLKQPKETVKIIKKDYNETKAKIVKEKKTKKAPPKKKTTKKSPPKGKKTPVYKTKKEQEKEFIEHMNSITRGYYENEPEYLKIGAKVGTQAFIVANQNIKIGDGSSKVSDEVFAKAVSSTIGQVVATGNFKMVPTKDKEYENNNKGVQKQVKVAKVEAKRKTRNSKDKDYYVRVDGKNKTVTVEESKRPKGYGSYLYKSLVLDPIESFHNFHEAKKAAFHGNIGGAFKNTLKGIGNLTSPLTLGVGSWAGDNYARFKPEEVQYGTKKEVEKRKATENAIVKTTTDIMVTFNLPKNIGSGKITFPQVEPAISINSSGSLTRGITLTTKTVSTPAITITGGTKTGAALSNAVKVASNVNNNAHNNNSLKNKNPKNNSKQNHNSRITNNTNSTAFTSNRNISASKIRNNGVKLDVPKDLKPKITDIAQKGDYKGFKTEEVVNEILKRDPNVELLDGGKYGSNNGFDHVFRNKKTGEVWILDSKQIAKSGNMRVSNKGAGRARQMSPNWVNNVLNKLENNNPIKHTIENAKNSGKLNTGLVGVDKKTGELIFVPVRITNK